MKNLLRVGILTLFVLLAIGGASSYLESASGDNLAADISSVLGRAASGIFNGPGAGEKFIGAVTIGENSSASSVGVSERTSPPVPREKININTAGLAELDEITGVGPVIAQRIIDYRDLNGQFAQISDINNVSGIGDVTFEKMKEQITVGN